MSTPYFDTRALLAMGMPKHVVDSLNETYVRTGGASEITVSLPDIDALLATALDQGRLAQSLKERVDFLELQAQTVPDYSAQLRSLGAQIEHLTLHIESQPKQFTREIEQRLEQLEAQPSLSQSLHTLTQRIEQLEAMTA